MKLIFLRYYIAAIGLIFFNNFCLAQSNTLGGGVIYRVADGLPSRCINGAKDQIDLRLVSMISKKHNGVFSNTASVGLFIETQIEGATSDSNEKITIPRSFMINVADYGSRLVRLPVEQKLLSRFRLRNGDNAYTDATFIIKLISSKEDGPAKIALNALIDVTKRLPIPSNPFNDGIEYFAELSNSIVSEIIDETKNPDQIVPEAQMNFEFSQDGNCVGEMERTGIKAVIKEYREARRTNIEYIDLTKMESYCIRYVDNPFKRIEYTSKPTEGCDSAEEYKQVMNPHYVFSLNAYPVINQSTLRQSSISFAGIASTKDTDNLAPLNDQELAQGLRAWTQNIPINKSIDRKVLESMKNYSKFYSDYSSAPNYEALAFAVKSGNSRYGDIKIHAPDSDYVKYLHDSDKLVDGLFDAAVIDWDLSGSEAAAQDIYVSIQRCKLIGIEPENCF